MHFALTDRGSQNGDSYETFCGISLGLMVREIDRKGKEARFEKVDRGMFALRKG